MTDLKQGDCLEVLRALPDNSVDSLVTDPPAGISFMGKAWDDDKGGRREWITWLADVMRECHRVLKPGAHGLVWALPRTSHWTATALEEAGFEIRDRVQHIFGSGFPKSLDVSKAIDKAAGAEREKIGFNTNHREGKGRATASRAGVWSSEGAQPHTGDGSITAPATDAAKLWQGWGTALKPASEDWWLVRKPLSEKTVAKNVLRWGTGCINIDKCRIVSQTGDNEVSDGEGSQSGGEEADERRNAQTEMRHLPEGNDPLGESDQARQATDGLQRRMSLKGHDGQGKPEVEGRQVELRPLGVSAPKSGHSSGKPEATTSEPEREAGSRASARDGKEAAPTTKANRDGSSHQREQERQSSGESLSVGVGGARQGTPKNNERAGRASGGKSPAQAFASPVGRFPSHLILDEEAGQQLDLMSGPCKTGGADRKNSGFQDKMVGGKVTRPVSTYHESDGVGASRFFYCAKVSASERNAGLEGMEAKVCTAKQQNSRGRMENGVVTNERPAEPTAKNHHPTVKPQKLMRYLCRMITPPGGTVLDCFMGSGSTGLAALSEGFQFIGIEREQEYLEIASKRIFSAFPEFKKQYGTRA